MQYHAISECFIECVARICHEANRAYCLLLGDTTQPPWEWAPEWQRESARAGVEYRLANPFAEAGGSHEQWLKHKEAEGWKYGPIKNSETKEHPCMVPFEELPPEQRVKDELFAAICRTTQIGLVVPLELGSVCRNRTAAAICTMYECGLPKGHAGVCVPAGAQPIPEAKPQYQPGDDE